MTDYSYKELAEVAFEMLQDIDTDIAQAEYNGNGPTPAFYEMLKHAIEIYNYYAGLANDCEDCNFREVDYVETTWGGDYDNLDVYIHEDSDWAIKPCL